MSTHNVSFYGGGVLSNVPLTTRSWRLDLGLESDPKDWSGGSNQWPLDCKASMLTTAPWPLLCFYGELTKIILELSSNEPAHEIMVLYCIGDQWRLRQACASAQSRQSLRCSHTWTMEVKKGLTKIRHLASLDGCSCVFEEWIYGGQKVPKSHELAQIPSLSVQILGLQQFLWVTEFFRFLQ